MKKPTPTQRLRSLIFHQNNYLAKNGGCLALREGDDVYNKLSSLICKAYAKAHERSFIGHFNLYGTERQNFVAGKTSALEEYDGGQVYNFGADFLVPVQDKTLEELLRAYNDILHPDTSKPTLLQRVIARVYEIGGEVVLWT